MDAKQKPGSGDVLRQIIPPLAAWAVTKILERPRVKHALARIDRAGAAQARKAHRRAMANRVWLVAGAAALVVGLGFMSTAARKK